MRYRWRYETTRMHSQIITNVPANKATQSMMHNDRSCAALALYVDLQGPVLTSRSCDGRQWLLIHVILGVCVWMYTNVFHRAIYRNRSY